MSEMPVSATNARPPSMLPPPPGTLKRKTLVDRAGEPARAAPAPPSTRPINAAVKPTSIAGISRQASYTSLTSSRPGSVSSSRNVSNASFTSSLSDGRPPSTQHFRPNASTSSSANSRPRLMSNRTPGSFDQHSDSSQSFQTNGNRTSMTPFHSTLRKVSTLQESSLRKRYNNVQDPFITDWSTSVSCASRSTSRIKSLRDTSLSTRLGGLSLNDDRCDLIPEEILEPPCTPSHIPRKKMSRLSLTSATSMSPKKPKVVSFLTKDSNTTAIDWSIETRMENMETSYIELKEKMDDTLVESDGLKDTIGKYRARASELDMINSQLTNHNTVLQQNIAILQEGNLKLQQNIDSMKGDLTSSFIVLEELKRKHSIELDEIRRHHRQDLEDARRSAEEEARRLGYLHRDEISDLRRRLEDAIEDEKARRRKEIEAVSTDNAMAKQRIEVELALKEKALRTSQDEIKQEKANTLREREIGRDLREKLSEAANCAAQLEASMRSMRARVEFLESDCKSQSQAFADLEQKTQDAIKEATEARDKLRIEETLRRKLHNQVQELKGNIRVFCRVRPSLESDPAGDAARISFPDDEGDSKEVEILGAEEKSSLGKVTTKKNAFAFDRVFTPAAQNADVFDEISQLVQSALDGYNVCIFCYGQTGAGKTFTMSSADGMIPRAVRQIYDTAKSLEEKGWRYCMEGSFVEVYNENINDLLGKAEELDKKKHEIRHDMQKCKTVITDVATVELDSPTKVETMLRQAMANRSVAATMANERSSRSHTVFILKLTGENSMTGEKSEGTLNLVDLAGSERLSHSGSTGERLKETQSINKSLSCLGDVIGALGQGKDGGHIPYRNSKLTYLLQFSLGGNSKTLMFVMISPLQAHLHETLTSLKFATKVHNTHIGTAKRQTKT
ncbi:kinesin-like nuclear fusion protein [Xylographa carneopallida]|nr:kinesin-like nuclear fusion protein [Xylographa carneopallida]